MKKQVLAIEDTPELRRLLKVFLSDKFETTTAQNGAEALSLLQSGFIPDIIISDLMMPETGGESFITQIKSSGVFRHIPVIVLSSIENSSDKIRLLTKGADDYLTKPFNPAELIIRVENLLNKQTA